MTSQYRHRRASNPATVFPTPLEPGEIAVNTGNRQLAVGDAASATIGAPLALIAVRYFDARAIYAAGELAVSGNVIYRSIGTSGPGAFTPANWQAIAGTSFPGTATPLMDGAAAVGTALDFAREDHRHPTDTSLATKTYTDAQVALKVAKAGDTMTGALTLPGNPANPLEAATKQYVDSSSGGVSTNKVSKSGDTMTGALTLPGNPANALEATPKQYVDAVQTSANTKVAKAGDTMTGDLTISKVNPVAGLNKAASGQTSALYGSMNGLSRWALALGNSTGESGSNAGSDLSFVRFNDAGAAIDTPVIMNRNNGIWSFTYSPQGPTPAANDNSTTLPTTAWVVNYALKISGGQTTTGGYRFTTYNAGSLIGGQTFTPDAYNGNYQTYTNAGAHTFAAPAADCALDVLVVNGAGAGAITFSGYTVGTAATAPGDPLTLTNGHKFVISVRRIAGTSTYTIKALQ